MALDLGINSKAKEIKKIYLGVNGKAKEIKNGFLGVNGKAKQFYSDSIGPTRMPFTIYWDNGRKEFIDTGGDYALEFAANGSDYSEISESSFDSAGHVILQVIPGISKLKLRKKSGDAVRWLRKPNNNNNPDSDLISIGMASILTIPENIQNTSILRIESNLNIYDISGEESIPMWGRISETTTTWPIPMMCFSAPSIDDYVSSTLLPGIAFNELIKGAPYTTENTTLQIVDWDKAGYVPTGDFVKQVSEYGYPVFAKIEPSTSMISLACGPDKTDLPSIYSKYRHRVLYLNEDCRYMFAGFRDLSSVTFAETNANYNLIWDNKVKGAALDLKVRDTTNMFNSSGERYGFDFCGLQFASHNNIENCPTIQNALPGYATYSVHSRTDAQIESRIYS